MAQLIKKGALIENSWQRLDDDSAVPASTDIIVSLPRWQAEREALLQHDGQVGVCLQPGEEPEALAADLHTLPLIAIEFPQFVDGRGYSYARELRSRYQYQGEIRAVGDVLKDQLFYLWRCGFDAFDIRADKDAAEALAGLRDFSVTYQSDARNPQPIYRRRDAAQQ